MNLCKDCKHYRLSFSDWFVGLIGNEDFSKCTRTSKISRVTGRTIVVSTYCDTERDFAHNCGAEGKYFEEKII